MSKNILKSQKGASFDIEQTEQGHFLHNPSDDTNAPVGLATHTDNHTQGTVFDAIDEIEDSSAKAQAYNALVYRAGYALLMGSFNALKRANFVTRDVDTESTIEAAVEALHRNAKLYSAMFDEAFTYATNAFEQPQSLSQILERALNQTARKPKDLTAEEREALGLSEAEANALKAAAIQRAEKDAKRLGDDLLTYKHEVLAIAMNLVDGAAGSANLDDQFTAEQHDQLFECVAQGLERVRTRTISVGMQYDGDFKDQMFSNAREYTTAKKIVEKRRAAFRRANIGELRNVA